RIALNDSPNLVVYQLNNEIYSVTFDGTTTRLTENANYDGQPALSPDQSKIIYVSTNDGSKDLWMMNADGSGKVNLSNTPDDDEIQPDWGN
ncbi:MAG: TolB family protein, partial [Candidatus Sericytochromatia bacterium]